MHGYNKARIEKLRQGAIFPRIDYTPFYYHFYKAYLANRLVGDGCMRYALSLRDAFAHWGVEIEPGECIVGRPSEKPLTAEETREWETLRQYTLGYQHPHVGQDSHMAVDYRRLLTLGTSGVRAYIDTRIAALSATDPESVRKTAYYHACQVCLAAVEQFSDRYAEEALRRAADCTDPIQAAEYREIAEICSRVPKNPASTFREAIQSVSFLTLCLSVNPFTMTTLQFQLGRPDRYLLPYYEADIAAGRITDADAQTLLDCLAIQINHRVPHGLSSGYMVGGRDTDGKITSNPLTRMAMLTVEQVRLVYPSVGLCCGADTPEEDIATACAILAKGHSHPALFGDDVIQRGLREYGLTDTEAAEYIHSTCVEITPIASSNVWVASPYLNLPGELNTLLDREYSDMQALWDRYAAHLTDRIAANCQEQVLYRYERRKFCLSPLLSCFVHDCLEDGVDIEEGGARYNWIMPSFVGLSNAADALYAIDTLVFREKAVTIAELRRALEDDFIGHAPLFAKIRSLAKYGNGTALYREEEAPADSLSETPEGYVAKIAALLPEICATQPVPYSGGRLIPSLFCWIMHDEFGKCTGATADGRRAGFPLGDGSGPAQGRELDGPTTSLLASTCWDHTPFIGGIAVNMKFSRSTLGNDASTLLQSLAKTYLSRGGFEWQVNVVDNTVLEDAVVHPENYPDLVVRIGGYSDYFTRLSPTMQKEVIARTSHVL